MPLKIILGSFAPAGPLKVEVPEGRKCFCMGHFVASGPSESVILASWGGRRVLVVFRVVFRNEKPSLMLIKRALGHFAPAGPVRVVAPWALKCPFSGPFRGLRGHRPTRYLGPFQELRGRFGAVAEKTPLCL